MKKAFLTIALAAFALAGNAQFLIGANLGFGMFNGSTDFTRIQGENTSTWTMPNAIANPEPLSYDNLKETMTLSVMPKIGYMIGEKMQVGLAFGIVWDKTKDYGDYKYEYQTVENFEVLKNPKYEVYTDKKGEFRFRLKASNGEIIATGEGYKAKASCLNGIASIGKNAPDAEIVKE